MVWQLNEPWPAISWALISYCREPKPAYDLVRRVFSPVLISLDYAPKHYRAGEPFDAEVWIINDGGDPLPDCRLEVTWLDQTRQPANRFTPKLDVAADSAEVVGQLKWTLPEGNGWRLACRLEQHGQMVAKNEYDLAVHDELGPGLGQHLWQWLIRMFMPE